MELKSHSSAVSVGPAVAVAVAWSRARSTCYQQYKIRIRSTCIYDAALESWRCRKSMLTVRRDYLQNQISELLTVLWWLPEYILPTREMTKPSPRNMQTKKMPISNRAVQVVRSRKSGGGWGANHPNPDCTTGSRISGREEKGPGLLHALVNNNRISSSTNLSTTAVSHPPTSLRHSSSMVRIEDIRSTCQMLAWGWHLQRLTT